MALFHLTSKIHGKVAKSGGEKSIAAVVAYRHCFKFDDFDYTKKSGLVDSFLMFPQNIIAQTLQGKGMEIFPDEVKAELKAKFEAGNVRNLWKAIEAKEKRKDAQLCQEIEVSLQHELSLEENIQNLKTLINNHFIKKGLAADVCIHNSKSGDNLHAHILITQRPLESIELDLNTMEPIYKFGNKLRDQEFFKAGAKVDQITPVREEWANLCNISFEKAGIAERISHKTLEAQREEALEAGDFLKAAELDREPVKHIHRSESFLAQHEREAEAEKAEYYNQQQAKHYETQLELVKAGLLDEDLIVVPVFKPVVKTFADKLKQRTLEKARIIKENAERYFKDRTDRYSRFFKKARRRAEEIIETTKSVARSARYKYELRKEIGVDFVNVGNDNEFARSIVAKLDSFDAEKQRNVELDRQIKQSHQIEPVAKSIDLSEKLERKVDERMKPKLWFDSYQRPELKPSWIK